MKLVLLNLKNLSLLQKPKATSSHYGPKSLTMLQRETGKTIQQFYCLAKKVQVKDL